MKKIFQNKSFLKSVRIFLVCLVVLGGIGNIKNVEAADNDILVYYTFNMHAPAINVPDLGALGFTTTVRIRAGASELTNGTINLSDYGQVWIIDDCGGVLFTAAEISAIENFRNSCGGLLLSVDNINCQERVNPITKKFNNNTEIFFQSPATTGFCCSPTFTWAGYPVKHSLYSGLNNLSSSISDACFNIQIPNLEITAKNPFDNSGLGCSDIYGAVLDEGGKGRIVFDSSITRFILYAVACNDPEKSQYQQNIAQWLDVCVPCPLPPTCTLTATPSSIYSGGSSILTWTTADADTVEVDNGVGSAALNNLVGESVSPTETTTYKLTATSASGDTTTCSATVAIVVPPPPPLCDPSLNLFCNPLKSKTNSIADSLTLVALYLLSIARIITLLFIVIAGIRYMLSIGNEEKMKPAKDALFSAGLGLLIILLSYTILSIIHKILNA